MVILTAHVARENLEKSVRLGWGQRWASMVGEIWKFVAIQQDSGWGNMIIITSRLEYAPGGWFWHAAIHHTPHNPMPALSSTVQHWPTLTAIRRSFPLQCLNTPQMMLSKSYIDRMHGIPEIPRQSEPLHQLHLRLHQFRAISKVQRPLSLMYIIFEPTSVGGLHDKRKYKELDQDCTSFFSLLPTRITNAPCCS